MAGEDRPYTNWIREQPCAACGGPGPCEPHHATNGTTHAPGERPKKDLPGKRGKSQRAHDHFALPLHVKCHAHLHALKGAFAEMDHDGLADWQTKQVAAHRERHATSVEITGHTTLSRIGRELRNTEEGYIIPGKLDPFEATAAARSFSAWYGLSPQAEHDLVRLLKRAAG